MIKAAFIGTGNIAKVHLDYLKSRRDVKVAGLCDPHEPTLRQRQQEYGSQAFADYRKMLDTVRPGAVWICTPSTVRQEPLLACADRQIPVFCEKPVERVEQKARQISAALARRKARVQVGYVFRSLPLVQKLRALIREDRIHLFQSFYGCDVSLKMSQPAWFYDRERSGGALVDQATHNFDLLRYLLGEAETVEGVAANPVHKKKPGYTIDETFALSFRFAGGLVGSHIHTWVGDGWRNEIMLSGEKRLYRLNLGKQTLTVEDTRSSADPIKQKRAAGKSPAGLVLVDRGQMYNHENRAFLQQVISGNWRNNPSDYANALESLRLTLAANRAIATGKPARLR